MALEDLPPPVQKSLREANDRTLEVFSDLIRYERAGALLPPEDEPVALATICINDLAHVLQTACRALHDATHNWTLFEQRGEIASPDGLAAAVHWTRYHVDHAAVALSAASNHLASAMWHVEENEARPLGGKYKSARQALDAWGRRAEAARPRSHGILSTLLDAADWSTVSTYRDDWTHRSLPVIRGEFRTRRRVIWQQPGEPAPGPHFMTVTAADGRVAYHTQSDDTPYALPGLIDTERSALGLLIKATYAFVPTLAERFTSRGIELNERGARVRMVAAAPDNSSPDDTGPTGG